MEGWRTNEFGEELGGDGLAVVVDDLHVEGKSALGKHLKGEKVTGSVK